MRIRTVNLYRLASRLCGMALLLAFAHPAPAHSHGRDNPCTPIITHAFNTGTNRWFRVGFARAIASGSR